MTTMHEILATALREIGQTFVEQGNLPQAVDCYRRILAQKPDFAAVYDDLGQVLAAQGDADQAIGCFRQAVQLDPALAVAQRHLGQALQRAGQLDEAIDCYRRVVELNPAEAAACCELGHALKAAGNIEDAVACYRQALTRQPDQIEAHNNLGNLLQRLGRWDEAVACYRQVLQATPDNAVVRGNLGVALLEWNQRAEAVTCFRRALELKPDFAEAHCNLGHALHRQGQVDDAIASYRRAVEGKPDYFEAYSNLGGLLLSQSKLEDAVRCYQRAVELRPELAKAHCDLGTAHKERGHLELAAGCYQRALELDPASTAAHCNLGVAHHNQGQMEQAIACFRKALEVNPDYVLAHHNLLFALQYCQGVSLAELAAAHAEFDRQHAAPLAAHLAPPSIVPGSTPRRLGFVSADFGRHPVGYFLVGVLEQLRGGPWETVCYSDRLRRDDLTERLHAAVTEWHEVSELSDAQLAEQIRSDRIDILFDLAGHTRRNRLLMFARKPAPVQITWAGYASTTGLGAMDYILADRYEIPVDAEPYYQERVLRMPDGYVCYTPPSIAPTVTPLPALTTGNITLGCFNNPAKVTPLTIDLWITILRRLPEARLVLKYQGWNDPAVVRRVGEQFTAAIGPGRVEFLGQSSHIGLLAEYQRIDLALDPLPYTGGLTTCEALWMGVPVITCPGETFASRHSLSHLSNVGLTDTIASDLDDYVERAVSWASDLPRLATVRAGLRERMAASPLCDAPRFVANLVTTLQQAWDNTITEHRSHTEHDEAFALTTRKRSDPS